MAFQSWFWLVILLKDCNLKVSGIEIDIKAGATVEESSVSATGESVDVIADSERASFGIATDEDLKRAVGNYFGKEPNDAFLRSPTPWDDLYKSYGWEQVHRVLQPKRAEILEISTKPSILATKTFNNDKDGKIKAEAKISEQVTNSMTTEWSNSNTVSVGQSINYGIALLGVGGETSFGFEQTWGKSETVSKESSVGTETVLTIPLKPGESVVVELSASSGTMRVRITYEAHLTGVTAVNYNPPYKDHHFHALAIEDVLKDSNKVEIVEDIEVGYYSNAVATVRDS